MAARVMVYNETAAGTVFDSSITITQGFVKRHNNKDGATHPRRGVAHLTYEELRDLIKVSGAGIFEHTVAVNETMLSSMPWSASFASDFDNRLNDLSAFSDAARVVGGQWNNVTNAATEKHTASAPVVPRHIPQSDVAPLAKRVAAADLSRAQNIVSTAVADSARRNGLRLARPLRNIYGLQPGSGPVDSVSTYKRSNGAKAASDNSGVVPLLRVTDEIANAAALVAEVQARGNSTRKRAAAATGTYWMQGLARKGTVPWGDDSSYIVFRNVLDYGAVGDGVTVCFSLLYLSSFFFPS